MEAVFLKMLAEEMMQNNPLQGIAEGVTQEIMAGQVCRFRTEGARWSLNRTVVQSVLGSDVLADLHRTITKSLLGTDVLTDLNASPAAGSISKLMLETSVQTDLNKTVARPFGASLSNPYGVLGTAVVDDNQSYTVASSKVLVVTSTGNSLEVSSKTIRDTANGDSSPSTFFPSGTTLSLSSSGKYGWSGMLFNDLTGITPLPHTSETYPVPSGKTLVITPSGANITVGGKTIRDTANGDSSPPSVFPSGTTLTISSTASNAWSGYLIDPTEF